MTGLLDPSLRVPPVPVDTADVCSMHGSLPDTARTVADDLDDVRRSAQQLLSGVDRQPSALRIRAGDVLVELEWADENAVLPAEPAPVAAAAVRAGSAVAVATAAPAPAPAPAQAGDGHVDICAGTVGTFYRAAEPGTAPFVSEGDHVRRGQQVAIIEVMKLMIPVEAERDGQVVAVHVTDGTSVEYGDRLLTIAPATGH
ncbi:acetyl-CoA carboxylase biotin carboxyl carrier protein [Catellatospora sichuanensis]|uniref:acetyl-CoA carboxylase biotin carboxyl carrier protein n=1 Tax=Catellatospora sichuanensis TaxID=1969805 RepID=UPI0011835A85|nr:acetyl-CoA carboxylase biotin carboxyl carrier protein subunit [Catellatospora sichuanensis]